LYQQKQKNMNTIIEIAKKIESILLTVSKTEYFTVYGTKGDEIKIRIGNHSCNRQNNSGKTLSFITARTEQRRSGYNQSVNEWEVSTDTMLTDTCQKIEEVLAWENVAENQEEAEDLYYAKMFA
jgi:hypothetical protein